MSVTSPAANHIKRICSKQEVKRCFYNNLYRILSIFHSIPIALCIHAHLCAPVFPHETSLEASGLTFPSLTEVCQAVAQCAGALLGLLKCSWLQQALVRSDPL